MPQLGSLSVRDTNTGRGNFPDLEGRFLLCTFAAETLLVEIEPFDCARF